MEDNQEIINNIIKEFKTGGGGGFQVGVSEGGSYQTTTYQQGPETVVVERKTFYDERPAGYQVEQYGGGVSLSGGQTFETYGGGTYKQSSYDYEPSGGYSLTKYEQKPAVFHEEGVKRSGNLGFAEGGYTTGGYSYTTYEHQPAVVHEEAVKRSGNLGGFSEGVTTEIRKSGTGAVITGGTGYTTTEFQRNEYLSPYETTTQYQQISGGTVSYQPGFYSSYEGGVRDEGVKRSGVITTTQVQSYEPYRYEEAVKRSGGPQIISSSDYKPSEYKIETEYKPAEYKEYKVETEYKPTEYKEYKVETEYKPTEYKEYRVETDYKPTEYKEYKVESNVTPYDYRTGTFLTFEYRPSEVKTYVEYQQTPATYVPAFKEVERSEGVKRAGVHETVVIENRTVDTGAEELQIRQMGEEIERIRASNAETFRKFSSLQSVKVEISQKITQIESELMIIRGDSTNLREIQMRIEGVDQEIQRIKISGAGVNVVDNAEENNRLLNQIREEDYKIDSVSKKIQEYENMKTKYMLELSSSRENLNRSRGGTAWCC